MYIVFEGADGTGKSTLVSALASKFLDAGNSVVTVAEPSNTIYGNFLREIWSKGKKISSELEEQLFLSDRKELMKTVIRPALAGGVIVLSDRSFISSAVYQGGKNKMMEILCKQAGHIVWPDVVFVLNLLKKEVKNRIINRAGGINDNDEEKQEEVTKCYEILSEKFGWININSELPLDYLVAYSYKIISNCLSKREDFESVPCPQCSPIHSGGEARNINNCLLCGGKKKIEIGV